MVYRIPLIEGVPLVSAKPYLAMDSHKGQVRVILTVETKATVSSTRVTQFLSAEQRENTIVRQSGIWGGEGVRLRRFARVMRGEMEGETPSPEGSPAPAQLLEEEEEETRLLNGGDDLERSGGFQVDDNTLVRSTTPSLPPPSTLELTGSVDDGSVEVITPEPRSPGEYTPPESEEEEEPLQGAEGVESQTPQPSLASQSTELEETRVAAEQDSPNNADIEQTPPRGGESILASGLTTDQTLDSQTSPSLAAQPEIVPESVEDSPSDDDEPKSKIQAASAPQQPLLNGHAAATDESVTHNIGDLLEESDDSSHYYAPILEKTLLSRQTTANAVEKHRAKDVYITASDSLDGYDDPSVLDSVPVTMRRVPSDEAAEKLKKAGSRESESNLDFAVRGLTRQDAGDEQASPYEDPATLDRSGLCMSDVQCRDR